MEKYLLTICLLSLIFLSNEKAFAAAPVQIFSPDKAVKLIVSEINEKLTYTILYQENQVIEPSPLGLVINQKEFGNNIKLGGLTKYKANEKYQSRGVHSLAVNRFNAARINVLTTDGKSSFVLEVRVFNDGAAFRYLVNSGKDAKIVEADKTGFIIPLGSEIWYQGDVKYYEGRYQYKLIENVEKDEKAGPPVTVKLKNNLGYAAITEAGLTDFAGMSLTADGRRGFTAALSGVTNKTGSIETPWRVVTVGSDLNTLLNSDIIANLSPPFDPKLFPQGFAADWIKPGRSVWSWLAADRSITPENMKRFTDRAAELGFEYNLVDEGWSNWKDAANGRDEWDLIKELVDYSAQKGVKIWVWKAYPDRKGIPGLQTAEKRRAFFKRCQELGIVGLKIDFFDSEGQEIIRFYQDALRDAAEYHLMLNFHGANKPTGESRTYPNEMTREAVRGLESRPPWALHNATLPFTRYLAGHADYTPLHFGERMGETSWSHQIAGMIVFTSPFLCLGASPADILNNPNRELIKSIPPTWDETIVLPPSSIGELALFARRKGDVWFVAALNGTAPKQITVNLSFLGKGNYQASLLKDDELKQADAAAENQTVNYKTSITINLTAAGGFVGKFVKK